MGSIWNANIIKNICKQKININKLPRAPFAP